MLGFGNTSAPQPDVLTTAGCLARREGQVITVDHLTITALKAGVDTDLAIDVRKALGLPMPGREGGARCAASKHIPTTGAACSICGAAGMQHEDDHPGGVR